MGFLGSNRIVVVRIRLLEHVDRTYDVTAKPRYVVEYVEKALVVPGNRLPVTVQSACKNIRLNSVAAPIDREQRWATVVVVGPEYPRRGAAGSQPR